MVDIAPGRPAPSTTMAIYDPFAAFDESPYRTAPQLPLQTLVILVNALVGRMPVSAPQNVKDQREKMRAAAIVAAKAMVVRLRETNQVTLAGDLALDNAMDGLFTLLRDGLRGYRAYERPGLDFLLKEPDYQGLLEDAREKARKAGELLTKLFGDGNLDILKREFAEQAALVTNVINLIDEDQHEGDLIEVTGDELFPIIRRVHTQYLAMVDRRTRTTPRGPISRPRATSCSAASLAMRDRCWRCSTTRSRRR